MLENTATSSWYDRQIGFFHQDQHLLPPCKDCGSIPALEEHRFLGTKFYITCPNKTCRIRQSTREFETVKEAMNCWIRLHKYGHHKGLSIDYLERERKLHENPKEDR